MKKVLLLTGAVLGIGALTACGNKQAKDIDLSIKEMDEKFKLPDNLLTADDDYAEYAIACARNNIGSVRVPKKTVYEEISNVNSAVKSGKLQVVNKGINTIPIDISTVHRYDRKASMSLYDNYITEYTLNCVRKYKSDRNELTYRTTDQLYNYWYEPGETAGTYDIKNYVKQTRSDKDDGAFDYRMNAASGIDEASAKAAIEKGVGTTVNDMYMSVLNGGGDTYVSEALDDNVFDPRISSEVREVISGIDDSNSFDDQIRYYRTGDYKSIYIFQSSITGVGFVFPSSSNTEGFLTVTDMNKVIPVYSVRTMVAKVSRYGEAVDNWQVDYAGLYGKAYATKDDNLITFDKPRCVSSEYYYASSTYDNLGVGKKPEAAEEAEEYEINGDYVDVFNGIAVQQYSSCIYYPGYGPTKKGGLYYNDFGQPRVTTCYASDISENLKPKEDEELDPRGGVPVRLNPNLELADYTVQYRKTMKEKGLEPDENTYYYYGTYNPGMTAIVSLDTDEYSSGPSGMVLGVLQNDETSISAERIMKLNDFAIMPGEKFACVNGPKFDSGGYDWIHDDFVEVEPRYSPYVISGGILDHSYNVSIYVKFVEGEGVQIDHVLFDSLEAQLDDNSGSGELAS